MESMSCPAKYRLVHERKRWRVHRYHGWVAKPALPGKGEQYDLLKWECAIPGEPGTCWEKGMYPVTLVFPSEYPDSPPQCYFPEGFFHPNVDPSSGRVYPNIVKEGHWKSELTIKHILVELRRLLSRPDVNDRSHRVAWTLYTNSRYEYERRVSAQAYRYTE
ncbi:hypothetical protein CBR_g4821 [Chara braunii]|uniref:UBC core domain-containing protein n=1 Tax=Chara braunii TaxID=69332 RepID=A0A388KIX7_CHABU|nr:hypothetical protein CBR_g4821 [Chara braunii]|eukprot:GBG69992.1 hypothetical protein CBR_g4821 [Chara braunii]